MTIRTTRNLRRVSQILFFGIFLWLILETNFEVDFDPDSTGEILLPFPVSIALQFDPLTGLATILATGTLIKGFGWSLLVLIPTIFLGRFFCGWVCPLGTLNHWLSEFGSERRSRKGKNKIQSNQYHWYQRIKYYIFFFTLAAALAGTLLTGLLTPLSFLARSLGTFVLPTIHTTAAGILGWIKSFGIPPVSDLAEMIYNLIAPIFLPFRLNNFHTIVSIGLLFIIVMLANRWLTRVWCRGVCPLGAMLGLFARFSIFGLKKNESTCDHCDKCLLSCQGADNPVVGKKWRQAECHLCLNCQADCPQGSLSFEFFPNHEPTKTNPAPTEKIDLTRRKVTGSVAGGFLALAMFRTGDDYHVNADSRLIRPPGSVEEKEFLQKCIRCGQCMRVCPNNAVHPTLMESGVEGIWTPFLIMRIGYCEPTCTLCGQVCPTQAIEELTMEQKVGSKEIVPNRIGTAFVDPGRCLPWSMATKCIVCEEWCPTSPKAIYLQDTVVKDIKGNDVAVRRPVVDVELCTGCGACEFACPVIDRPAIYCTSIGESRSSENQLLLQRSKPVTSG